MEELKKWIDQIEYIDDDSLKEMDFFDAAMYLEKLNQIEQVEAKIEGSIGDSHE